MFASEADGSKRGRAGPVEAATTFARNLRQSGHAATRDWRVRAHGATGFPRRRRSRWYRRDGHVRSRGVDEPHNDTRRSEVGRAGAGCLGRPAGRDTRMLVRPSDEQRNRREHGRDRQRQAKEPDALAVAGHQLLISIVIGFCIDETGEGGRPPAEQPPPQAVAAMARDYLAALPAERFPNLVDLADHHADADADQRFELLLGIFVDGLAQRAAS